MVKAVFKKLVLVQKIILAIVLLGLVSGAGLYLSNFSRSKAVDCSQVPKMDNAEVVRIENGQFNPGLLTVKVCDTILFLNLDSTDHQPKSSIFDSGHALSKLDYFQYQVTKTGKYSYNDYLHPQIEAQIIVEK